MAAVLIRRRATLTGNVRGRPRVFSSKLILQVELRIETANAFESVVWSRGLSSTAERAASAAAESAWRASGIEWRDATWEDQLQLAARPAAFAPMSIR